jgi:hypothetical protein
MSGRKYVNAVNFRQLLRHICLASHSFSVPQAFENPQFIPSFNPAPLAFRIDETTSRVALELSTVSQYNCVNICDVFPVESGLRERDVILQFQHNILLVTTKLRNRLSKMRYLNILMSLLCFMILGRVEEKFIYRLTVNLM